MSEYVDTYLAESVEILRALDAPSIDAVASGLAAVRDAGGRLFVLGVGGSAAHASHAVNDLRKICGIESYAPTDNVAELTARVNDAGWESSFSEWLKVSRLGRLDALLVLSVGGGSEPRGLSVNLVRAVDLATTVGARVFGVVGRDGGHTRARADACVLIPVVQPERVTVHTEGICAVVLHLLVSHPTLKRSETTWELAAALTRGGADR